MDSIAATTAYLQSPKLIPYLFIFEFHQSNSLSNCRTPLPPTSLPQDRFFMLFMRNQLTLPDKTLPNTTISNTADSPGPTELQQR